MGIHGLLKELGPPPRQSLAALAAAHYTNTARPLRLAVDIAIWLFQIQAGKGGSNPALRTFYYRLLRLVSLNIHPLFVFDGPNKPLFKRNKKVGGPGVRVASVPEFLAKQLLKQLGFPWHIAPGEAEAECALLQREGVVDAVLSEDVDTLMFGSGLTFRNWSSDSGSSKTPTHVQVYREAETQARSGLDCEGMVLVALMSGGDYLMEGIPGCGPKLACDAARAGYGRDLCALGKKDAAGLQLWKDRLQHQIRTNEAKYFSRKVTNFVIPADFPNLEVLGYYTHPCVSTLDKVARLRSTLRWDAPLDFPALRLFTAEAFDWRYLSGAKKFIRNLAPALLVRELRLQADAAPESSPTAQAQREDHFVRAIHGKRNHACVDAELEYRISFLPSALVPLDLELEEEDDEIIPAGGEEDSEAESDAAAFPPPFSAADAMDDESGAPVSPSKKRPVKAYDPNELEKLWILRPFLQLGCPLLVEEHEASLRDPKALFQARRKAKAAGAKKTTTRRVGEVEEEPSSQPTVPRAKKVGRAKKGVAPGGMAENSLLAYTRVTKLASTAAATTAVEKMGETLKKIGSMRRLQDEVSQPLVEEGFGDAELETISGFLLPRSQIPNGLLEKYVPEPRRAAVTLGAQECEVVDLQGEEASDSEADTPRPFARFTAPSDRSEASEVAQKPPKTKPRARPRAKTKPNPPQPSETTAPFSVNHDDIPATPPRRRPKRPSPDPTSPAPSQRSILSYYSPSPRRLPRQPHTRSEEDGGVVEVIDLISSSPAAAASAPFHPPTPSPPNLRFQFVRSPEPGNGLRLSGGAGGELDSSPGKLPETVTKRRKKVGVKRCRTGALQEAEGFEDRLGRTADEDEAGRGLDGMGSVPASPSPVRFRRPGGRERETGLKGLGFRATKTGRGPMRKTGVSEQAEVEEPLSSSYPTPPADEMEKEMQRQDSLGMPSLARGDSAQSQLPGSTIPEPPVLLRSLGSSRHLASTNTTSAPSPQLDPPDLSTHPTQRSHAARSAATQPHQTTTNPKRAIQLRQSLEGGWKEVDLTDDGSGWAASRGRAQISGSLASWRKSGVEVLDMTGA